MLMYINKHAQRLIHEYIVYIGKIICINMLPIVMLEAYIMLLTLGPCTHIGAPTHGNQH